MNRLTDETKKNTFQQLRWWMLEAQSRAHMHCLNPSTSAKPFMTKLQNLFVALVNIDIFQMTLKFSLFTVD